MDGHSSLNYSFNGIVYVMMLEPATVYYVRPYALTSTYAVGYGEPTKIITGFKSDIEYGFNWAAPSDLENEQCLEAMETAVQYLRDWTSIAGFRPYLNYESGKWGADCGYGGWISAGESYARNPGVLMHEMGHAMHGLLSDVQYESLSGTNVKRDFVEMPSQVMENWCYEPEFLSTFARHYRTGEPLPTEYIDKIRAAQNHMAGWLCLRQLNLGFTDIAFHTMGMESGKWKAESVEAQAMTNLLPRVEGCCTATSFSHIFGGGYASGYYGYKWAEVLDADIFSRFKHDGIFNRETAEAFRREILSRGGTEHPAVLFKNFMGREPDNQALLKRMNLL